MSIFKCCKIQPHLRSTVSLQPKISFNVGKLIYLTEVTITCAFDLVLNKLHISLKALSLYSLLDHTSYMDSLYIGLPPDPSLMLSSLPDVGFDARALTTRKHDAAMRVRSQSTGLMHFIIDEGFCDAIPFIFIYFAFGCWG